MSTQNNHSGLAALSICEALLLAMSDRGLLPPHEIVGVLRDAAATHENAIGTESGEEDHQSVIDVINAIITGWEPMRRA